MSDLIERDKAIDAIREHIKDIDGDDDALDYIATNMLKDVPSARPTPINVTDVYSAGYDSGYEKGKADRLQGKWIRGKDDRYFCDNCGCVCGRYSNHSDPLHGNRWNYCFCPNCGADMRKRKESE